MKHPKYSVPKLPDSRFTSGKSADNNRVFLFENKPEPPFIKPVAGWKIIGWGNAPWPGSTDGFAVMFEKTTPAAECGRAHEEMPEGTHIWQHYEPRWLPGHPDYEGRMARAAARKA